MAPASITERRCGGCTVCCTVAAIEAPDLVKPAGVTCRHCEAGCRIHPAWPAVCRDFFCGWRALAELDDAWRPDRSGVLIVQDEVGVPAGYASPVAYKFILTKAAEEPMSGALAAYLSELVRRRTPVFLSLAVSGDTDPVKALLNPMLAAAAARHDIPQAASAIARAAAELAR